MKGSSTGYVCPFPRGAGSNPAREKAFLVIFFGIAVRVEGALTKITMFPLPLLVIIPIIRAQRTKSKEIRSDTKHERLTNER